jgi:hypothetical protein
MRHWWASLCNKRFVGHENNIQNAPCNRPLIVLPLTVAVVVVAVCPPLSLPFVLLLLKSLLDSSAAEEEAVVVAQRCFSKVLCFIARPILIKGENKGTTPTL